MGFFCRVMPGIPALPLVCYGFGHGVFLIFLPCEYIKVEDKCE